VFAKDAGVRLADRLHDRDARGALKRPQARASRDARNFPIVIPCHRVIGASGSLTGFGGGLDVKRQLLAMEARVAGQTLF
jgi:O-6-methylguanine DNA methyltransferase